MKKVQDHPVLSRLVPWVLFWAFFAWGGGFGIRSPISRRMGMRWKSFRG